MTRAMTLAIVGAAVLPVFSANAQVGEKPYLGTFNYTMAAPSGDSKDFANNYSWLGFTLEGDWFLKQKLSAGFVGGWQEIHKEQSGDSFQFDNGTATGRSYRHLMSIPLLARVRYWGGSPGQTFHPFVGLATGTYWMKQTVDFGIYSADVDHWHFGLAPEVGVLVASHSGVAWTLNARYNYPFAAGDYLNGNTASWSYIGIGIGIAYTR